MSAHPGDLLSAWLDGELAPDQVVAVAAHVAACPACAAEHEEVAAARTALRSLLPLVAPPAALRPSPSVHLAEAISALLDGELDPIAAAGVEAHLEACPACAAEREEVAWARGLLRGLPPVEPPEEALRPAIPVAVPVLVAVGGPSGASAPSRPTRPRWAAAGMAVAAAAVGVVALAARPGPSPDAGRPSVASFVAQHSTSSPGPDAVTGLAPVAEPISFTR